MSNYNRTTRECPVSQLRPELRQAIRSYFLENDLGEVAAETRMCCETVSKKKPSSRLVAILEGETDAIIHTGMLLTSQWLIWARTGDFSGTVLNAASLKEIRARPFKSMLTKDTGLEIFGTIRPANTRARGYVGMGPELAAQRFCEEVESAITELNPPPKKRGFARWFSGSS